jgi:insulysin
MEIIKPKFDLRKIIGEKLDNNIKYILIHDDTLEKAYVTISVNTGSFSNPKEYQGLAHFLEHMLFLGSKKYPEENHYSERLNLLGGSSNAYTSEHQTVYYFNVFNDGLQEIFDIFSRFFIDPLFYADSVNREINAVNSEHSKNINNDMWVLNQLKLYLTNKNSELNTFITGSLNSLNKSNIRDALIEFYNKYYISSNISICIASSKSIDEMKKIIIDTFGNIKNKKANNLVITKPFYSESKLKTFYLKTKSDIHIITYIWEIPDQEKFIDSRDFEIFASILTNRSSNSLYYHLCNLGYLNNISYEIDYSGIFTLEFDLTKIGFKHLDYIDSILFYNLKEIYNLDFKSYVNYYNKKIDVNFNYTSKIDVENLCEILANNHHIYETKNVLYSSVTKIKSNQEYKLLFETYINNNNFIKIILSQKYDVTGPGINVREYKSVYYEIPTKKIIFDNLPKLYNLDLDNEYLNIKPKIIKLKNKDPVLIGNRQWYSGYSKYNEPVININLQFNKIYFSSPKNSIMTDICCTILNFLCNIIFYKVFEINNSITFYTIENFSTINININLLNDIEKLKILVNSFINFILDIKIHFNSLSKVYIHNLIQDYKLNILNTNYLSPREYSNLIIQTKIYETTFSINELLKSIDTITYSDIKEHIEKLFINSALTSFIFGNIILDNALDLLNKFDKLFINNQYILPKIYDLSSFKIKHPNPEENSCCVSYYYDIGYFIPNKIIVLYLLVTILSEPFFNELRTKHQLGYIVNLYCTNYRNKYYLVEVIQSEKKIREVEEKINLFNKDINNIINKCDFKSVVKTFRNSLLEPENSLNEKFNIFLNEIVSRDYLFNRKQIFLSELSKIKICDLNIFVDTYINNKNRKIIIIKNN